MFCGLKLGLSVRAVAKWPGRRAAATAEGHGPLVGRQRKRLPLMVIDPQTRERLAVLIEWQFHNERTVLAAADRHLRNIPSGGWRWCGHPEFAGSIAAGSLGG